MRRRLLAVGLPLALLLSFVPWWRYALRVADGMTKARNGSLAPVEVPGDVDHHLRVEVGPPAATLDVWVLDPPPASRRAEAPVDTVLVLHGIRDRKETMKGLGERYRRAGLRAVLVDLRGHGQSSPTRLGFGAHETRDLVQVLDRLEAEELGPGRVGVYGPSYGAAIALQLAAVESRVVRTFATGGFSSFEALARPTLDNVWGGLDPFVPEAVTTYLVNRAASAGGFAPQQASPLAAARSIRSRVVMAHGTEDQLLPFAQAEAVARACAPHCELVALEGQDHHGSLGGPVVRERSYRLFTGRSYGPR
ncbi:MAG: alpha/beta fold hydrolase [Myxococcota bacterium]